MPTRLTRWGNSIGLRVPRHVLDSAGLQAGDEVYVRVLDSGDVLVRPVGIRNTLQPGDVAAATKTAAEHLPDW